MLSRTNHSEPIYVNDDNLLHCANQRAKIGALLRAIEAYGGAPLTRLALKLNPYIFPRPIESRTMEWAHVQLHGTVPEWRVPWRRMKMRKPHIVPLARLRRVRRP